MTTELSELEKKKARAAASVLRVVAKYGSIYRSSAFYKCALYKNLGEDEFLNVVNELVAAGKIEAAEGKNKGSMVLKIKA